MNLDQDLETFLPLWIVLVVIDAECGENPNHWLWYRSQDFI